jgi:4-coumarate--CoA ligase
MHKFLGTIQKHKCTFAFVVPPIVLRFAKDPLINKYDLSSMRMMNSGAAPYDPTNTDVDNSLTRELVEEVFTRTKIPIKQGYGLTEYVQH